MGVAAECRRGSGNPCGMRAANLGRNGRPAGERHKKKESDGWIAALVHWTAATYHWDLENILWETPLSAIALLRRQEWLKDDKIFPLTVIEQIDNG